MMSTVLPSYNRASMIRNAIVLFAVCLAATTTQAQATVLKQGKSFTKTMKGATGDFFTVVDGVFAPDGRHLLYVEEGLTPKVVRLDALMQPTEELVLKDLTIDGSKWTGVAPAIDKGTMRCLLVSNGKKSAEYGIGTVNTNGALSITGFRKLVTFEQPYVNDPATTMADRPLPDPILLTKGLAYVQQERLLPAADGNRLLNHFTHNGKGNKRFYFAYLDKDFDVLWNGSVELPYEDAKSSIHQIVSAPDGNIRLLTYVFQCKSEEQLGDKNCHELHLTTISENGNTVSDVLLEKDFVSSARILERGDGKITLALRYGSLTGQPGVICTFDPADPKLKPTPLLAQRLPSIRKTRIMAYGDPMADPRKTVSRTAKVPNEIVDLLPTPDGGTMVVETFLETQFPLPMGDAIAMRHLSGALRVDQVLPNDSLGWQKVLDRALMTTAGQPYEGAEVVRDPEGWLFLYGHTPKGYEAILRAGQVAGETKGALPAEPQVLKALIMDKSGNTLQEGTALMMEDGFIPCTMGVLLDPSGRRALVKSYDRGSNYRFTLIDLNALGK